MQSGLEGRPKEPTSECGSSDEGERSDLGADPRRICRRGAWLEQTEAGHHQPFRLAGQRLRQKRVTLGVARQRLRQRDQFLCLQRGKAGFHLRHGIGMMANPAQIFNLIRSIRDDMLNGR